MDTTELSDIKKEISNLSKQVSNLTSQMNQLNNLLIYLLSGLDLIDDELIEDDDVDLLQNAQLLSKIKKMDSSSHTPLDQENNDFVY